MIPSEDESGRPRPGRTEARPANTGPRRARRRRGRGRLVRHPRWWRRRARTDRAATWRDPGRRVGAVLDARRHRARGGRPTRTTSVRHLRSGTASAASTRSSSTTTRRADLTDEFIDQIHATPALLVPSIRDELPAGGMAAIIADPTTRSEHVDAIMAFAQRSRRRRDRPRLRAVRVRRRSGDVADHSAELGRFRRPSSRRRCTPTVGRSP